MSMQMPTRWRRIGFVALAVVNAALLVLLNASPGWQSMTFLTEAFGEVIGLVNASLLCSLLFNTIAVFTRSLLLRGAGEAIVATVTLVTLAKVFVVFPFSLPSSGWELPVRVVLGIAMAGTFVTLVAGLGRVARALHLRGVRARD